MSRDMKNLFNRPDDASAAPVPRFEPLEDRLLLSGLLAFNMEFPQGPYDATGTVTYDAVAQSFDSDATPLAFRFSATSARPVVAPRDFQLHIKVDNDGNLIGGVAGDDFRIEGQIDQDGDGIFDFDGVLLTGEILEFGHLDSGSITDQYNFRFQATGGDLVTAGLFTGKDIGVRMTSPNSTFEDDFMVDFGGKAQGVFGAIEPLAAPPDGSISGFVWEDFNNDGEINFNEYAIEGVTVELTGTDDLGNAVDLTDVTDEDGIYAFVNLRSGTYTITETQPANYADGIDVLGEVEGQPMGAIGDDVFTEITLGLDQDGVNYNFGERPEAGATVTAGQTATIGFWQNKIGQAVLSSVNEGMGDWLATTFQNMYGMSSAADLTGMTNAEVASVYKAKFQAKIKGIKLGTIDGPAKFDSQVMATAFAVYVTNSNLAGMAAEAFGFLVDDVGLGGATWNVGDAGEAFGVADGTEMTILDLLLYTNEKSSVLGIYDMDTVLRTLANDIYTAINEGGDI
ncbi:hypothetical protein LCGC14_0698170 [marine sediment metagenome]|uniref:SD-repeat containing protein B domain-containing protein n=1 Tax=marine sediment metagenome TaxID=412755 RepID=A0A0F9QIN0_9ZZZZ|nr:LEPR-XLL domain-containing protein [Phycisphaerae bacterium]HDZ44858.1 LEPR-XLL domain-containing protein [Phycisphaerae bacterium]